MSVDFMCYRYDHAKERFTFVDEGPQLNLSNYNAAALMDAIGITPNDPCGSVPPEEVSTLREHIAALIARPSMPTSTYGLPVEQLRDRIKKIDEVLAYAQAHGFHFGWG